LALGVADLDLSNRLLGINVTPGKQPSQKNLDIGGDEQGKSFLLDVALSKEEQ
jgi:hypothetical protein